MSGQRFVEALSRVGYPQASSIDGGSFDWIFEYDLVVPFLEWFCEEIQASNRLDPKDLAEFHTLEQSPEGILEGEQLEKTLQNISTGDETQLNDDQLKEEIAELEKELENSRKRKELLIEQRNKVCQHKTSLTDRMSKMDVVDSLAKAKYKKNLENTQADNTKMNAALEGLLGSVGALGALYQASSAGTEQELMEQRPAVFLSQLDLNNLYKVEEKFTTELTAFTKKLFFEGISDMAGEDEGSRYEFLEISNPKSLLVSGEKESTVFEACKDIARLQMHNPKSETLRINALVEEKCTSVTCSVTEQKCKELKDKPFPKSVAEISNRLKEAQSTLSVLRHDLVTLAEQEVPSLVEDSATLQVTRILRGNYDLKIARQDYFMSNQDQVRDLLVAQRSRNEFLTMALELEVKGHRDLYRLLTAINMLLEKTHKAYEERMQMLSDPTITSNRNQRSTLDSRDKFLTRIHQVFTPEGEHSKPQLFVTYAQLSEHADKLEHNLMSLRASSLTANSSQDNRLSTLEKTVRACESSVYAGSSTLGGHPTLSPQTLTDNMTQLEGMLKTLEVAVLEIRKDVDIKKKMLHNDPLLVAERELFVHFFTDPDRLRHVMEDVTHKLDARLVS